MNKKLMALAVAGAVTAPGLAVAQITTGAPTAGVASNAGITLYGRLDEAIMSNKFSSNGSGTITEVKKGDIHSAGGIRVSASRAPSATSCSASGTRLTK